jgi:hypothetical protein
MGIFQTSKPSKLLTISSTKASLAITMSDQSLPSGVAEALQRPSNTGDRSTIRKLSDFDQGVLAVSASQDEDLGELTHKFDLLCPRNGCGSVILKAGVGRLVERDSVEVRPVFD